MLKDVALDTSSLGALLTDSARIEQLALGARSRNLRVLLLQDALAECVGASHWQGPLARLHGVRHLLDEVGPARLALAIGVNRLVRKEVAGKRFASTPVHVDSKLEAVAQWSGDPELVARDQAYVHRRIEDFFGKDEWLAVDREGADVLGLPPGENVDNLPALMSRFAEGMTADHLFLTALVDDPGARIRIASDWKKHRSIVLLCAMLELNGLGALLHKSGRGAFGWLKAERGNWVDARIAANAAYAETFVAEDAGLRKRLEFLRQHGLCFFEITRLDEFLGEANAG
jgi:hypothetical protein